MHYKNERRLKNMGMREKALSGMAWKFGERIIAQLVSTAVSILLARLLMPEDYGVISIVLIFINIANTFVTTGFGQALVQDNSVGETEFSTLFYCSMIMSVVLYGIIFFLAPFISDFYYNPLLTPVLRVLGIKMILSGFNTIQQAYVQKNLMFKKFFFSTLIGTIISAVVGVYGAYSGWGVWALVAQYLINSTCDTVVLFLTIDWKPKFLFSGKKAKGLIKYSWKLTAAELVNNCYNEVRSFLIGKVYTTADLAFYTKGEQFPKLITVNVNSSVVSVLFPVISSVNDNREMVKSYTRRSVRISCYVIIPCMMGLAAISNHLIPWLLTDKWNACIPYMIIACVCYATVPINSASLQAIKAIGKSDVYLKNETIKKIIGLIAMVAVIKYGVFWVAFVRIPLIFVDFALNTGACSKYINYKFTEYIKDMIAPISLTVIMVGAIYGVDVLFAGGLGHGLAMIIEIPVGIIVYVILSKIFKCSSFEYIKDMLFNYIKGGRKVK